MNMELIQPDTLNLQLQEKLQLLKNALTYLRKQEKNQPEGHLRVAQKADKRAQYYHYTSSDNLTGKYIRKNQIDFAKALAQKDYNENIIQLLQKEIVALEEYLSKADCGKSISEFYTARGERVRSKSEILIADTLTRNNIPYRYEFPLELHRTSGDSATFYPDFLCLNVRTRSEFYWEHFGLMDSPEYSNNAAGKLRLYTENGILAGRNLIITMETQAEPLSTRTVNQMIEAYLT